MQVLLIEHAKQGAEDLGEAEAIVQAAAGGTMVIVDDPWGRKIAATLSLDYHGTLWVFEKLHNLELLSGRDLRTGLRELRQRKMRYPWDQVNALLKQIGEDPLDD